MRLRRRRKHCPAPPVAELARPEGAVEFRDAARAVKAAESAADRVGVMLPQMAALRERLRELRADNHFSERINEMLRQGYGPPAAGGGRR